MFNVIIKGDIEDAEAACADKGYDVFEIINTITHKNNSVTVMVVIGNEADLYTWFAKGTLQEGTGYEPGDLLFFSTKE